MTTTAPNAAPATTDAPNVQAQIDALVANAQKALAEYARFTQEDVNFLVKKASPL
jgi:acetaldehyde dehydrogenase/alcohol dehydrogenase